MHLIKWRNIILDCHDLRNVRKNTARGVAVSSLRGGCVWGLIISTAKATGEDEGGDGREDVGDDNESENESNIDDSNSDDSNCKEVKSTVQGHAFQKSSSSSNVTALKGSTVSTGTVSNSRNHHHDEEKKEKRKKTKKRMMVDEEGMRGVCQNVLSVMGQSLSQESMSSVIYGLRKEGGASE